MAHCLLRENGNEVGRMRSVIPYIFTIQHRMNPLHVYCRFMEKGHRHDASLFYCRVYEITVFSWMRRILRGALVVAHVWSQTDDGALKTHCANKPRRKAEP